jgi:hypothetical protein
MFFVTYRPHKYEIKKPFKTQKEGEDFIKLAKSLSFLILSFKDQDGKDIPFYQEPIIWNNEKIEWR